MSRTQKLLLATSGALLFGAEIIKYRQLSEKSTIIVGLVEVLIAIGIGVAFGVSRRRDEGH